MICGDRQDVISCHAALLCLVCHDDLCLIVPYRWHAVGNEQDDETSVKPLPHDHTSSNIPSLGMDRGYVL